MTASVEAGALALLDCALDQPSRDRAAWIAAADAPADVRERALALLRRSGARPSPRTGGGPLAGRNPIPERIGAYRITALIGEGGMGAVYRGERAVGDFDYHVAIKLVRPGALSDALVERFQRERRTLAGLSHPNIARLFDGGEAPNGQPYIVMELVDGLPLTRWLATRPAIGSRIGLFLAACEAVAYAHQNLIIHRDITPSNILVDAAGQPKLIDFGIARPFAATPAPLDGRASPVASLSLTPGFAAPERMAGEALTTAVDIFSLGKVLEEMVRADEKVDPEVLAIAARAAATEPDDRHPTVEALADEVCAWRAGFPVPSFSQGRRYIARKFVARHRAGVGVALSVGLLLFAAVAVTSWNYVRAEHARAQADMRFAQTRQIAKTLLFDVFDEVSRMPGSTRARAMLAETGVRYLDALARDGSAPPDVRAEAGAGYVRLSQVTGGGQQGQLGRFEDANLLLAEGEHVLGPLYARYPDHPDVRRAYATLLLEQSGANLYNNNQPARARGQAQQAEQLMAATAASDAEDARRFATAIQAQGDSWGWENDYRRARAEFVRAERFQQGLPAAISAVPSVRMARSANLRLLSEAEKELGDNRAALAAIGRAVEVNQGLVRDAPSDPALVRKLAISLWGRTIVLRRLDRTADARETIERAVALAEGLRMRSPDDVGALNLFAIVAEVQAQVLADLGQFAASYARSDQVIATHRRMVAISGNSPGAIRTMASAMATSAANHERGGDRKRACAIASEATKLLDAQRRAGQLTPTDERGSLTDARQIAGRACHR